MTNTSTKNVKETIKQISEIARTLYDKKGNITPPGTKPKEKPKATDNESKPEELDKDK